MKTRSGPSLHDRHPSLLGRGARVESLLLPHRVLSRGITPEVYGWKGLKGTAGTWTNHDPCQHHWMSFNGWFQAQHHVGAATLRQPALRPCHGHVDCPRTALGWHELLIAPWPNCGKGSGTSGRSGDSGKGWRAVPPLVRLLPAHQSYDSASVHLICLLWPMLGIANDSSTANSLCPCL